MLAPAPVRALAGALALALAPALITGCEGWECGYGGPGCGDPGLLGLCDSTLPIGQPVTATAVYFDDTGARPAVIVDLASAAPALLEVARGEGEGEVILTALAEGEARVDLEIEGWEGARAWTFTLSSGADAREPGACEREHVDPDPR